MMSSTTTTTSSSSQDKNGGPSSSSSSTASSENKSSSSVPYYYSSLLSSPTKSLGVAHALFVLDNNNVQVGSRGGQQWSHAAGPATANNNTVLQNISQLPEIQSVLSSSSSSDDHSSSSSSSYDHDAQDDHEESLRRAIDIFQHDLNKPERIACYALLAEVQNNDKQHAQKQVEQDDTLQQMKREIATYTLPYKNVVQLAIAKSAWLHGEFETSQSICNEILGGNSGQDKNNNISHIRNINESRDHASAIAALTGYAISRICQMKDIDDAFSIRDPFRMIIKQIERMTNLPNKQYLLSTAYLNLGIAEMLFCDFVRKHHNYTIDQVPLDSAMRSWNHGLTILQRQQQKTKKKMKKKTITTTTDGNNNNKNNQPSSSSSSPSHVVPSLLEAHLLANMAFGMLQMREGKLQKKQRDDDLKRASELANLSLQAFDALPTSSSGTRTTDGLDWTLALLGTCYAESGSGAVTAEGLYQSALEDTHNDDNDDDDDEKTKSNNSGGGAIILDKLVRRDILGRYANLCRDWEKREGQADQLEAKAASLLSTNSPWNSKSILHARFWFWTTPSLFQS